MVLLALYIKLKKFSIVAIEKKSKLRKNLIEKSVISKIGSKLMFKKRKRFQEIKLEKRIL